ncbi:MAG: response regulator [Deltaproteobacteria bacterium]|nr:response regulator [Deltaproteobacteria bacterium]
MGKTLKVLMVDDEVQFRTTTKKLLKKRGFEIVLAENGEEAIEKLKEGPDVVILDIKMPGMDGHQVLEEIKKRFPELPVIMLTGHGAMPSAKEAFDEGAFDYLIKPCDIHILASKITDAYLSARKGVPLEEKRASDVMIPLDEYTTVKSKQTVKEAIMQLKRSFILKVATSRIMETGHRSILVLDSKGRVLGILAITDLLKAIMPKYLSAPKPSMADSVQYSPMFWKGMFIKEVKELVKKRVDEVMSLAPLTIDGGANLMEAAYMMVTNKVRRLVVESSGEVIGILREQDLFFEMEKAQRGVF